VVRITRVVEERKYLVITHCRVGGSW